MHTALYIIWFLLPAGMLLVALWAKLEQIGKKDAREHALDYIKSAIFLFVSALIAVAIDTYMLEDLVSALSPDFIPLSFYQLMLLPLILVIGAKLVGGSKAISIDRAPRPSNVHKSRRR